MHFILLIGVFVFEIGIVYGNEKECIKGLGFTESLREYLNDKITCAERTGMHMLLLDIFNPSTY